MTPRVIAIRPEPGLTGTLAKAHEVGLSVTGLPLSLVEPVVWRAPAEPYDGLLVGSANVFRHGGRELDKLRDLPVLAVGETTAEAARHSGWRVEVAGAGGLQAVLDALDGQPRRLLRLAGDKRTNLDVPRSITIDTQTVYRVVHHELSEAQAALFSAGSVVLLHSGEAARHFSREMERCRIEKGRVALAALAPRIAKVAGTGWRAVEAASTPDDAAVLAIARELCESF